MIKILKYYWRYLFIFISVVFIFIGTYFMFKDNTYNLEVENKLASNKEEKKNTSSKTIYVDVKGAVKNPGVYELSNTSRVIDQTTPNMIQRISGIFERNPLISKEI